MSDEARITITVSESEAEIITTLFTTAYGLNERLPAEVIFAGLALGAGLLQQLGAERAARLLEQLPGHGPEVAETFRACARSEGTLGLNPLSPALSAAH